MDTGGPRVNMSAEERAALKKQQLARLAAQGSENYSELYASQPEQLRLAAEDKAKRQIERDAKNAVKRATIQAGEDAASHWKSAKGLQK